MPAFVTGFSSNNPVSRGIRRGICRRCLPDACSASPIKLGEMRKTKLYQSCHASRPEQVDHRGRRIGITSACAEQTSTSGAPTARRRDHLRVCGADHSPVSRCSSPPGSPPRVRSRPQERGRRRIRLGITSACAEQTWTRSPPCSCPWDHLRVCGADAMAEPDPLLERGSPPRVRSRQLYFTVF